MIRIAEINLKSFVVPSFVLLFVLSLTYFFLSIFFYDSYKAQFLLLNLILLQYLIFEFFNLSSKESALIFLQPYFLVIVFFFLLNHLLPNIRFFISDPAEFLPYRMVFWDDDLYRLLLKPMQLVILSAFALFWGYKSNTCKNLGGLIRGYFSKMVNPNLRSSSKIPYFLIFFIIIIGIFSVYLQISWGIFGYGISDNILEQYASYAQLFRYADLLQLLLVVILAYMLHKPGSNKSILKIILFCLVIFLSAQGFLFASKGKALMPILATLLGSYLSTGKIFFRYLFASILTLLLAFVVIEPYRVLKNVYPDASFAEAITLLSQVPDDIVTESVEEDITLKDRITDITVWFLGRNDNFSFTANAIVFKDRYGIPDNNNPDFLGSILYSPAYAYIPRFLWKSKPRDQIGAWYEDSIMQSPNYSASAFGAVAYPYYAGGVVAIFLVFYFFGLMQRLVFESFFKMNNLLGFCIYLGLILPITAIYSEIGGVITGFLRLIPVIIFFSILIFLDYKKIFRKITS